MRSSWILERSSLVLLGAGKFAAVYIRVIHTLDVMELVKIMWQPLKLKVLIRKCQGSLSYSAFKPLACRKKKSHPQTGFFFVNPKLEPALFEMIVLWCAYAFFSMMSFTLYAWPLTVDTARI